MGTALQEHMEPVAPSPEEQRAAGAAVRGLYGLIERDKPLRLTPEQHVQQTIELPPVAVSLLVRLLKDLASGHAVTLIPIHAELTTQQAADLLGVSRPFIIKQIGEGKLPYRMVGAHRRILFADFMVYRKGLIAEREGALDELAARAQEDGAYGA